MKIFPNNSNLEEGNAIYEKDRFNGLFHSKVIITKKSNKIPVKCVSVPKWSLVLFFLFNLILSIILISACTILYTSRTPGQYKDDCIKRSCSPLQNLKCINDVCTCPEDSYYYKKCYLKKTLDERCHDALDSCKSNLICFNGKCSCNKTMIWIGDKCDLMTTYDTSCKNAYCNFNLGLICSPNTTKCTCDLGRFWTGQTCSLKRNINQFCKETGDCDDSKNLLCINGHCNCNGTSRYSDGSACLAKKNSSEVCLQSIECLGDMICSSGRCQCSNTATHYFNLATLLCTAKTLNNTNCATTLTCRSDLGLSCVSNYCQCDVNFRFWFTSSCIPYKLHNEPCSLTSQCKKEELTLCLGSSCSCEPTYYYYDLVTSKCQLQLNESESCFHNDQCLGNMICTNAQCKCSNTNTHYFHQTSFLCTPKSLNNQFCNFNNTCRSDLGLSCASNVCQCDLRFYFWNGTSCQLKKTKGIACSSNDECQDYNGLSCRYSNCICNMSQFWNRTVCENLPPCFINGITLYYCLPQLVLTADAANTWCSQYDGLLYSVNNTNELNILINVHNTYQIQFWVGARATVGLDFRWSFTNQPVASSYWCSGEPNGGNPGEPCAIAGWCSGTYFFNDLRCTHQSRFLCEKR